MHRDIKPTNIMIDPRTHTLRLIDFGIAEVGAGGGWRALIRGRHAQKAGPAPGGRPGGGQGEGAVLPAAACLCTRVDEAPPSLPCPARSFTTSARR